MKIRIAILALAAMMPATALAQQAMAREERLAEFEKAEAEGRARLAAAKYTPKIFTATYRQFARIYFDPWGNKLDEPKEIETGTRAIARNGNLDLYLEQRSTTNDTLQVTVHVGHWTYDYTNGFGGIGVGYKKNSAVALRMAVMDSSNECSAAVGATVQARRPVDGREKIHGQNTVRFVHREAGAPAREGAEPPVNRTEHRFWFSLDCDCIPVRTEHRVYRLLPQNQAPVYADAILELVNLEYGEPAPELYVPPAWVEWVSLAERERRMRPNQPGNDKVIQSMDEFWQNLHPEDKLEGKRP